MCEISYMYMYVDLRQSVSLLQAGSLGPVCELLPRLQQQYSALARALDATRHDIPTSGLLPLSESESRHTHTHSLPPSLSLFLLGKCLEVSCYSLASEELEAELSKSEMLLAEIMMAIRQKIPTASLWQC